ncbi:MAG: hypothetical protein WC100_03375 [Sterolibacterium sp.]
MKIISAVLMLLLVAGCGRKKQDKTQAQTAVSKFATSPLPIPPPTADPAPVAADVAGAANDVEIAQSSVQTVLKVAEATPAAQAAVAPLVVADTHLTAALQKLRVEAAEHIEALTEQIKASEAAREQREILMQKDIAALKAAAGKDAATTSKQILALQAENDDLRNEAMTNVQKRMYLVGVLMVLGAIGSVFASIYFGFAVGAKLAVPLGVLGVVIIGLARLLPKIALYAEWGIIAGVVSLLAYVAWHLFHHEPVKKARVT